MKNLMKKTSSISLILLLSGCSYFTNNSTPEPTTVQMVDKNSIKSISDITSIAFEWKKVNDPYVVGYNFYRGETSSTATQLKLIKSLDNKYTTHYVDSNLKPNTQYIYQITSFTQKGKESKSTDAYVVKTLPRLKPIAFVQAISNLPNRIKILWRPHEDKTIKYYKIQRLDLDSGKWNTIKETTGRLQAEYIDYKLDNSETYKYRVIAYDFKDVPTYSSQVVTAKTKDIPRPPRNVKATNNLAKKIRLTWEPSASTDVVKYEIYRSPFSSIGYTKLAQTDSKVLSVVDNVSSNDKKYYYKIYALDKDGLLSNQDINPIQGKTLQKPTKPVFTQAIMQNKTAFLRWDSIDNRAVSFNLYKEAQENLLKYNTVKYTNIKVSNFEDNNIVEGVKYNYYIQAVDENGLKSEKSDKVTLISPKKQ